MIQSSHSQIYRPRLFDKEGPWLRETRLSGNPGFLAISAIASSVSMQGNFKNCFINDPVLELYQHWHSCTSDRFLHVCIDMERPSGEKPGFQGTLDSKTIMSSKIYGPWLSCTSDRLEHMLVDVERPKVAEKKTFSEFRIPGNLDIAPTVFMQGRIKTCSKDDTVQRNVSALALMHFLSAPQTQTKGFSPVWGSEFTVL